MAKKTNDTPVPPPDPPCPHAIVLGIYPGAHQRLRADLQQIAAKGFEAQVSIDRLGEQIAALERTKRDLLESWKVKFAALQAEEAMLRNIREVRP